MSMLLVYVAFIIGIETTIVTVNDVPYPMYEEHTEEGQPPVQITITDMEVGA